MIVTTMDRINKRLRGDILSLFAVYERNIRLLGTKMEWGCLGKDSVTCMRISAQIVRDNRKTYTVLDWSRLKLDVVPPIIAGLKFTETLDLSFNNIAVLPLDLKAMPALQKIILIGNPLAAMPLPKWCDDLMTRIEFVTEAEFDQLERTQSYP
jgi:Leucine-rich repeat (LRR) protein